MTIWLIRLITIVENAFILILFASILLSFFVSPWNKIRQILDRIVNPLLNPIRRIVPRLGVIDISPLILLILVQVVATLLRRLVISLG